MMLINNDEDEDEDNNDDDADANDDDEEEEEDDDELFTRSLRIATHFCLMMSYASLLTSGDNALLGTVGWNRHCKCNVANTNCDSRMVSPL